MAEYTTKPEQNRVAADCPNERLVMRLESVWIGKDNRLLDSMLEFYAPNATRIIDVCCNKRRMWKDSKNAGRVAYYDRDKSMEPDVVCEWGSMPDEDGSVDVLVYDPPHMPDAAGSKKSLKQYATGYGLGQGIKGDNIDSIHGGFLTEAKRVLKKDGLIFAKIKDYVHSHRYQWNMAAFNDAVRLTGMTPCDLVIKRDPCGGNLKSGRWNKSHHARNVHCYWIVVRNSARCEAA